MAEERIDTTGSVERALTSRPGGRLRRAAVLKGSGLAAALAGGTAFIAACGVNGSAGGAQANATKKPVQLTYMQHSTSKRDVDVTHFNDYKQQNPHVSVEWAMVPDAELAAKVTSLFVAGSGPDIFNSGNSSAIAYADRGWTAEVDPRAMGLGSTQKLVDAYAWPNALDGWKWKGKFFGVPTEISNYCLYINNRLFRQAGLDPQRDYPKDWDEMVAVAQRLTKREGGEIVQRGFEPDYSRPQFHWGGHAYQLIGPFLTEDSKVNLTAEGAVRTLQWWTDWSQKYQLGSSKMADGSGAFQKETNAMWISGAWFAPSVKKASADLFNDMTIKPFPRWKDKKYDHGTHVYGYSMMVSSQASKDAQAEAWKLAWYLSGFPLDYLSGVGLLQPTKQLIDSPGFKSFKDLPSLDVFLDDMKKSTYTPRSPVWPDVVTALKTYFAKSWTDGQPAKQVLPDVQREVERILATAGK